MEHLVNDTKKAKYIKYLLQYVVNIDNCLLQALIHIINELKFMLKKTKV